MLRVLTLALASAPLVAGCGSSPGEPNAEESPNRAPRFAVAGEVEVHHNEPFELEVTVTDPDGDPVTVSAGLPGPWMTFDATSRTLRGRPTLADVGDHQVRLSASDGELDADASVTVSVGNRRPAFAAVTDASTEYDTLFTLQLQVGDLDGDPVTVTAEGVPEWMTFDPATLTLSGLAGFDRIDNRYGARFRATDGLATTTYGFEVHVRPPTLTCNGSWTVGWPQVCDDGRPVRTEHVLVFSDASHPDVRRQAAQTAEEAIADAMVMTETSWSDFDFHPDYDEPLVHLMTDYNQQALTGLAYPHGAIVRATDSPRFTASGATLQRWRNVLQHELTHVIEFLLIGTPQYWSVHEVWLREGFASYGARLHTVETLDQLNAWRAQMADKRGGGNPIAIRRFSDMDPSIPQSQQTTYYPFFELATRYLIDPANGSGHTLDDLKGMFEDIEDGVSWEDAFRDAFGFTVDEFEATFWERAEAYLSK